MTTWQVPKDCPGLNYISSEEYESDLNFDRSEKKTENLLNKKYQSFCDKIVVIEEEWFYDMNWTFVDTLPPTLMKYEKLIINKINFPHKTKWHICTITMNKIRNATGLFSMFSLSPHFLFWGVSCFLGFQSNPCFFNSKIPGFYANIPCYLGFYTQ